MTLAAHALHAAFDGPVLRDANASFPPGSFTAIIGPNGAGKSTLLRCLAALHTPARGRVTLDDLDLASIPRHDRARRIAYIPQRGEVGFAFRVRDIVSMGRLALPPSNDAVTHALRDADLVHLRDAPFPSLSAGQQQRVLLARALAQLHHDDPRPRFLLADEPVAAMDPRHALLSMNLLAALAPRAVAVVAVLHDLTLAARFADRTLALDDQGSVAAIGPTKDILNPDTLHQLYRVPFAPLALPVPAHAPAFAPLYPSPDLPHNSPCSSKSSTGSPTTPASSSSS